MRSILLAVLVPVACLGDSGEDLLAAVRKGDAARVKALLAQGADDLVLIVTQGQGGDGDLI